MKPLITLCTTLVILVLIGFAAPPTLAEPGKVKVEKKLFDVFDPATGKHLGKKVVEIAPLAPGFQRFNLFHPVTGEYVGMVDTMDIWSHLSAPELREETRKNVLRSLYAQFGVTLPDTMPISFAQPVASVKRGTTAPTVSLEGRPMMVDGPGATCTQGTPGCDYNICHDFGAVCPGTPAECIICR